MGEDPSNSRAEQPLLRDWTLLDPSEQTALRIEYGRYLDSLPPTCSMERKIARFRTWLREERGIAYTE